MKAKTKTISLREGGPAQPGRVWGGPSLQQGDPSVSLGLTAPFTQGSLPLLRRRGGTFPLGKGKCYVFAIAARFSTRT